MAEQKQRGRARGPRPHQWKSGAYDEYKHSMYTPFLKAKAQANYRKEEWELTFEEFYDLWKDRWTLRGRNSDDYSMTRDDSTKPWNKNNILIIPRGEQIIRSRELHPVPKKYKTKARIKRIDTWLL